MDLLVDKVRWIGSIREVDECELDLFRDLEAIWFCWNISNCIMQENLSDY